MSRQIPQFEKWEKPAESKLFSDSLSRVFDNYAHFCVTFVSYLHGKKEHPYSHRTRSSEVAVYVEAVKKECDEAFRDAQAAAACNNTTAHHETHRMLKEIEELIQRSWNMRDSDTVNDNEAQRWRNAVDDLHKQLKSETISTERHTEEISQLRSQLKCFEEQQTRADEHDKHRSFLNWIGFTDTRATANAKLRARKGMEQTGDWIYEDSTMKPWFAKDSTERSVLWLTADPGFGKSCLTVRIIQDLGGLDSQGMAWYFCTGGSVQEILQTWIHHLLALRHKKSHLIMPATFIDHQYSGRRSVSYLCDMLKELFGQQKPTWLIVDGLDECRVESEKAEEDFRCLFELLAHLPTGWEALIVSRNSTLFNPWLEEELGSAMAHKTITREDTRLDLELYSKHEMAKLVKAKGKCWTQGLVEESEKRLQEKASGMFMWVSLVSNQVQRERKADKLGEELRKLLRDQPKKLQELYENELKALFALDMSEQDMNQTLRAVRWAACASRRLTIAGLADVLLYPLDALQEDLERHLGSFVRISDSGNVEIVHETAAAFLLDTEKYAFWKGSYAVFATDRETVHRDMVYACLELLTRFNDRPDKPKRAPGEPEDDRGPSEVAYWRARNHRRRSVRHGSDPEAPGEIYKEFFERFQDIFSDDAGAFFLPYAANAWMSHLERCKVDDGLEDLLRRFFCSQFCTIRWLMLLEDNPEGILSRVRPIMANTNPAANSWWDMLFHVTGKRRPRMERYWNQRIHKSHGSVLHVAALFDMTEVIEMCLRRGYKPNFKDSKSNTPLHFAARGDAPGAASILLAAGADPNARNQVEGRGLVALFWSVARFSNGPWVPDSFAVTKILLQHGANPNAITSTGRSPWKLVQDLPQDEPQVQEISAILRSHGMVPHARWKMPIEEAARNNDLHKARRAIKDGQAVNMLCDRGATRLGRTIFEAPLHAALNSAVRIREMIELLLDSGADPRMPQADGRTPLHLAIRYDDGITDLFCDLGVDINAQAEDGCTPMHDILRVRGEAGSRPMKSLQNRNARMDTCDAFGRTAEGLILEDQNKDKYAESKTKLYPLRDVDIIKTLAALEQAFGFRAPRHLVLRILDLASYWRRSVATRHGRSRVEEHTAAENQNYLRSPPLDIRHPKELREMRLTIRSCDQGWSISGWAQGSHEKALSFCEIFGARESGERIEFAGEDEPHYLFDNIHGDGRPSPGQGNMYIPRSRQRVIIFGRDPPRRKSTIGLPPHDFYRSPPWLDKVRKGDTFWIRQGAKGKDWVCFVDEAEIEVFTSPLVPKIREMHWKVEERKLRVRENPQILAS